MTERNRTAEFLFNLLMLLGGAIQMLFGPTVSALAVAWLCGELGLSNRPALFWIVAAPALYLAWLVLLLVFYALEMRIVALFFERPRRWEQKGHVGVSVGFAISGMLYGRCIILSTLPLLTHLFTLPLFKPLILLSYSTKYFIGRDTTIGGLMTDPDITFIGDGAVVGGGSTLIPHSLVRTQDGRLLYQTAPIEIGAHAVVGGEARIDMGTKIGAGAIVEPRSHVLPYTIIPPGEIWGGNPAVFHAKRENSPAPVSTAPAISRPVDAEVTEICALIARALALPAGDFTVETSSANCAAWDSFGKMAISAAIYDRFRLTLEPEEIFQLNSVADVEHAVSRGHARNKPAVGIPELPANPEFLPLLDPGKATAALAAKFKGSATGNGADTTHVRVVIAATFVAQPLGPTLELWSRAFGIRSELEFFDFNQVQQALLSPASPFRKNRDGLNVVLIRPEDIPGVTDDGGKASLETLLGAIKLFAQGSPCPLLVSDIPAWTSAGSAGFPGGMEPVQLWWREQLKAIPGVQILGFAGIIRELGTVASRDSQMEKAASTPYSPAVYQQLGVSIARAVRKLRNPPKKVLALDCDGTLWGGVIAEDGMAGIRVGNDADGRSFQALQTAILSLKRSGVFLALVSKNEPEDVWNVIEQHPGMLLRRGDFASAKINWNPKSQSLRDLAAELNLDASSFVLLDDNVAERLEVEANCAAVTVVPLPPDPAAFAETLGRLWLFDGAGGTHEDAKRNDFVHQEAERKHLQASADGLQSYLASLELKVEMKPAQEEDLARVSQLTQRTNQFNLSLKRRTLPEIRALLPEFDIWVVSARDRFGDYGLVGGCICRKAQEAVVLDSLLVSCRALGRGIEDAFLHGLALKARAAGTGRLQAPFLEGPRNQPVKTFLARSGFNQREANVYELDLARVPPLPGHLEFKLQ